MKMIEFWFKFHWNMFPYVQLTICQHWFREWLGACLAPSHYLDQWWPSSLMHICSTRERWVKAVISKHMSTSCDIALRWMPQNTFDDKSTLIQVMAWCCLATRHNLNQRWPRSMPLHGVTSPQCVDVVFFTFLVCLPMISDDNFRFK